jgi:hypothetical protein
MGKIIKQMLLLSVFALFFIIPCLTFAGSISLSWDANKYDDDIAGYRVYYGQGSRAYGSPITVGNVIKYTVGGLTEGKTYYFSITAVDTSGNESNYSAEVFKKVPSSLPPQPGLSLQVSNLTIGSGKMYEVVEGLKNGIPSYIDRGYTYENIPAKLFDAVFIRTANSDKKMSGDSFITFDISKQVKIFIAYDDRNTSKPSWLSDFTDTDLNLLTSDAPMSIYEKQYAAGRVALGGNDSIAGNMYTVVMTSDVPVDNDGDGYAENQGDCDDTNARIYPGAEEICGDGIDQNCDGMDRLCFVVELEITNLAVDSGRMYDVVEGLKDGTTSYIDRDYTYQDIPEKLVDAVFIRTANNDKKISGDSFITFDVNKPVKIFIAYDDRNTSQPSWLYDFTDTDLNLITSDVPMRLYEKQYAAGRIVLGGNDSISGNMYTVAILPDVILPVDGDEDGYTEEQGDCDDTDASIYPGAEEICGDGIDQDCDGTDQLCPENIDDDRDGYTENQGDCDDTDARIYPGAEEICGDGIDQDCDGTDQLCPENIDDDRDGYTENQGDCDDTDARIYPGAEEICGDGIDQDCDGKDQLCPVVELELTNVSVASGKKYEVVEGLDNGEYSYIDRSYTYQQIPDKLVGAIFIKTANNDKKISDDRFITFTVNKTIKIFIAYDDRNTSQPSWLSGFTNTGLKLITSDVTMGLYEKQYAAGNVTLGANDSISGNMYTIIITSE